jgi:mannose-6-phosphate isomerase-like protein (cupin superfamily)
MADRDGQTDGSDIDVVVLDPEDGTAIDYYGAHIIRKASRALTEGHWAVGTGVQNAGFDNALHRHEEAEAFFVVRGRYTFYSAAGETPAGPGTFVFIPPGAPHGFRTEEDDSQLFCIWPASVEQFFFDEE